ncbi:phage XkdN-like protein [Clostridium saccharobutylicum]|uniref:phage tail assembly chaperone n=1 Tax=Clostridium saccharobutylicum TaxID=169679 RepID=UPI000983B234|nr:hypothetical protein [Clostridium saccharobutylicum]AQS11310.1 phage XkdN-like protein [Clostridium saccharobutylicum]MBC2437149.1 hypothetical protein [Clostridium saccharobutylicum]NSB88703.1 hypothetical protein [Clostridium saccharobutylicum]NYC30719.1 hypothetical protein [Clostridium saccharobutylicum]OOM15400.1 phage XkdN-like protein [Clostridium saccharobutylicum]
MEKKVNDEKILDMKEKDILSKLMGTHQVPKVTVLIERLRIPVELKGLTEREISQIRKECMGPRKKVKGEWVEKVNNAEFDAGIIVAGTTNFDWNNQQLLDSIKVSDGKQYIRKTLLAGEISNLVNKVLELSGFNDELEEAEDIKNS